MNSIAELFPAGGFRFHLGLRRGEPDEFFRRADPTGGLLAERRRWLAAYPQRHAALQPGAERLLAEFAALATGWGTLSAGWTARGAETDAVSGIGAELEPDFLLLSRDTNRRFRLRGGALCFPTGWALEEKLGRTIEEIHGIVPGLNASIGEAIEQFFARLKPGAAFHRDNWGLAATGELNLHPARGVPAPALPVALDRLWLRVEHQAFVAMPETGGVLFGIRIALHRLDQVVAIPKAAGGLARALATMPDAVAEYKRLESIRAPLIAALGFWADQADR